MAFREIKGEPTLRVVRAACSTAIKTIEPDTASEIESQALKR